MKFTDFSIYPSIMDQRQMSFVQRPRPPFYLLSLLKRYLRIYLFLTFPQQQTLRGHRRPDHKTVGLVKWVGQTLQLLRPIHPWPQGHSLFRQAQSGSMKRQKCVRLTNRKTGSRLFYQRWFTAAGRASWFLHDLTISNTTNNNKWCILKLRRVTPTSHSWKHSPDINWRSYISQLLSYLSAALLPKNVPNWDA